MLVNLRKERRIYIYISYISITYNHDGLPST